MLSWCICIWLCQFEVPRVNLLRLCSCMEALKDLQVYEWTVLPLRSSSWVACACHSRWQSLVGMAKTANFASQGHRKSSCQKGRWMADFSQFSVFLDLDVPSRPETYLRWPSSSGQFHPSHWYSDWTALLGFKMVQLSRQDLWARLSKIHQVQRLEEWGTLSFV